MKRHIPGLHHENRSSEDMLEGVFLVRVDRAFYRWHPQRPFFVVRFAILEPKEHQAHSFTGRLYCTPRALWKLNWFLRDFGYDPDLMGRDEVDEKALLGLRGIVRVSHTDPERPLFSESRWVCAGRRLGGSARARRRAARRLVVTFSYTQIAQYLRCPRSYRHRYLDGWREKDTRASLLFGRCFEKALAAFFSGEDSTAALFKEWAAYQDAHARVFAWR